MTTRTITMTTEPRPPKREPYIRLSSLELRLYVVALLGAIYTLSWRAIGGHAPAPASPLASAPAASAPAASAPQHVVWIDSVRPVERPAVVLPAGWQLASEPRAPVAQPRPVVRAPTRRVPRMRTRSS
jgi:hypothetical protein